MGPFFTLLRQTLSLGMRRRWRHLTQRGYGTLVTIALGLLPLWMVVLGGTNFGQSRLLERLEAQDRLPSALTINPFVYRGARLGVHHLESNPQATKTEALEEGLRQSMGPSAPQASAIPDIHDRFLHRGLKGLAPYGPPPLEVQPSPGLKPTQLHQSQALGVIALLLLLFAGGLTLLSAGLGLGALPQRRRELAWLRAHPLSEQAILGSHILTQGLLSPIPPLLTLPLFWALLVTWGSPATEALFIALGCAYALSLGVAALGVLAELSLPTWVGDSRVDSLRGGLLLLGAGALCLIPLLLLQAPPPGEAAFLVDLVALPPWNAIPGALGVKGLLGLSAGLSVVGLGLGLLGSAQRLRQGLHPSSAPPKRGGTAPGHLGDPSGAPLALEAARLLRAPSRFASVCLLPILLGGIWLGLGKAYFLDHLPGWEGAAALAFAFGGAVILSGTADAFTNAAPALWLILTHPQDPMGHFRHRARFVAILGAAYGLVGVGILTLLGWSPTLQGLLYIALMAAGLWLMAHLGVALSILLPREDGPGMRPLGMYAFVLLGGLYLYGLTQSSPFALATPACLMALGVIALWNRAKATLPWALDPTPPALPNSPLIHGLIALLIFYVGQGVVGGAIQSLLPGWRVEGALIAFAAGGLGATLWLGIYLRRGVLKPGMLRPPEGQSALRGLIPGMAWGVALVALAVGWMELVDAVPQLREAWDGVDDLGAFGKGAGWLWVMGVLLAPLVEELLFRGALLQGLAPTLGPWGAIGLTALTFTALHPGVSAPPIFLLGVITGRLTLKTGWLGSAILCHALYNLAVLVARVGGLGPT